VAFPALPTSITNNSICTAYNRSDPSSPLEVKYCGSLSMKDRNVDSPRPVLGYFSGGVNYNRGDFYRVPIARLHDEAAGIIGRRSHGALSSEMTKAKFVFAPDGNSRGQSFRMIEAMSAGAVPVYVGEAMIPPFSEILNFTDYGLYVKYSSPNARGIPQAIYNLSELPQILKRKAQGCDGRGGCEWERLQANAIWVYEHYFATSARAIAGLLEVFTHRLERKVDTLNNMTN